MKGKKNRAVGTVKEEAGRVTKNRSLQAKGAVQKTKGTLQDAAGKTTRRATKRT
ncbi:MAG: CsbD family protein [Planctomycetaceae bacterium]